MKKNIFCNILIPVYNYLNYYLLIRHELLHLTSIY